MLKSWIVLIVLSSSLVTGCVGWGRQVKLPFPESPTLVPIFVSNTTTGAFRACLTREDAANLAAFFDKLEAFKHAYER